MHLLSDHMYDLSCDPMSKQIFIAGLGLLVSSEGSLIGSYVYITIEVDSRASSSRKGSLKGENIFWKSSADERAISLS